MGVVWIASISLFGISAVGAAEAAAIEGVLEALKTHSAARSAPIGDSSAACEVCQ